VRYVLRRGSLQEIGGKALALGRLGASELPIPEWFAVSPDAFAHSLSCAQKEILASGQIEPLHALMASLRPAGEVAAEIAEAVKTMAGDGMYFAVRSSAVEEDGAENSFAGQLASYLFVDAQSVPDRVADVWRSGFSDRLLEYRRQRGMAAVPLGAPAVLVQRMVDAEKAGVAFSVDPVSGRRGLAIVSAVFGVGTSLVGGESDADVYAVNRTGEIERWSIAAKKIRHRFDPNGEEGVSPEPLPEAMEEQPVLSPEEAVAVAALARSTASTFGQAQDIEWAYERGALYLLQARPITTLRGLPDPDGALNIWDNSNITESYNGVTTPLTFSFARSVYEGVYRQFCRILHVPKDKIAANDTTFRRMLGLVRGRVYYNLLNWYRVLSLLPGFAVNRRFMEQMMGVRESIPEEVVAGLNRASTSERLTDSLNVVGMVFGLLKSYFTLSKQIERFNARLEIALAEPSPPLKEMRLDELTAHYDSLVRQLLTRWDAPLVNDFFAMIFHGVLRKLTAQWCGDQSGMLANDAIRGGGGMISAEPAMRVQEMAGLAAPHCDLVSALLDAPLDEALRTIRDHPVFRARYESYIEKFGDRCLEELKLESETLHENPLILLRGIGELARAGTAAAAGNGHHGPPAQDALQTMRITLKHSPFKRAILTWVVRNASERVRQRENLRFERTRIFGRIRRIFLEAGRRLHAIGELDDPRDVFYLQVDEVLAYVDGNAVTAHLKRLVAVRIEEFDEYRKAAPPADRFETRGAVYHAQSYAPNGTPGVEKGSGEERTGIGCCPGIVRGVVRVVRDPRNAQFAAGSILVADHTDPGWIMLFPSASGLLVERGSLLSHSAIVARELGIPAVVSIPGLTAWLNDGDMVELDGAQGTVRRLSTEETHAE
jgi:phosphohistidine swiveling domain-containing protein